MRQKRLDAEMTLDDAADALEWSTTKISNIETGRSKYPAVSDVGLLLTLYKVEDDQEKESILSLTRQARKRGWWNRYDDVLTGAYASLEAGATGLRLYEPLYIPGLLQVPGYMNAASQATLKGKPDEIERLVEARLERQKILTRTTPPAPDVWAIIDEHVLHVLAGTTRELHREQIEHLIDVAETPNTVTVQVLPCSVGLHAGMGGAFAILDYDEAATVFLETDTDGLYLDKSTEIDRYRRIFDRLVSKAMDPDEVPGYLRSLIN